MIRPGPRNLITDLDGLRVGNAGDLGLRSGTTVLLPDWPMTMAVDVRGGAPGTRDTEALAADTLVERFHALVLSGGSVFGLAAADGVTGWLSAQGIGLPLGPRAVPVVPSAILFDLANGGDKDWGEANPYPALGRAACEAASRDFPLGNVGAGIGAKAGSLKGGLGSASAFGGDGLQVGAIVGANPFGEMVMPGGTFWAWALELDGEWGGRAPGRIDGPLPDGFPPGPPPVSNTVIAAVATNLDLTKAQATRLAMMAQDGIARAVRPAHTPFDGDTVFAVATGTLRREVTPRLLAEAGAMAADCLARAMARAVFAAGPLGDKPSWRQLYG
ncbi:P1 family peptidase [Emcibacter sp. SYSU 3D8]|uniref:P1 family peptidase n=1 Tax=Emcibacter sp. SYSU 3D8 TaxID=3133969 RepID=UPI0031FF00ED